ncbi:MAG TPA: hypothetical protein VGA56_05120 [Opitutaceae bacterium]
MAPRDTYRYVLRDGRKVVQYGITDDLERREEEHDADDKRFTSMTPVGPRVTRETAEAWEQERIDVYKRTHEGRPPRYNKS